MRLFYINKIIMKHLLTTFFAAFVALAASAGTTYNFSSSIPAPWTSSTTPLGYEASNRGAQWSKASGTLTLSGCTNVTEVKVVASSNVANGYTISVTVGGTALGTSQQTPKESNHEFTFSGAALDGDLVISFKNSSSAKSFWIKSVTVEGTTSGGSTPGDDQGGGEDNSGLDTAYVYPSDTIVIVPVDDTGKGAFDKIYSNIRLQCNNGALYATDIRVYANAVLTISATRAIKAIRVDGLAKKGFYADASAGTLSYASDDEQDVTAAPVLLIKDIDTTTVAITCGKQLQIQTLYIYFAANPDEEIEGGGGGQGDDSGNVPVASTGSFPFVTGTIDSYYYEFYGELDIYLYTNATWYMGDDGIYGDGDGTFMALTFYPLSTDDITGTYSIADETLDADYSGYFTYLNDVETINTGFASGTLTIAHATDSTYAIAYNLVDSLGNTLTGAVTGLVFGSASGGTDEYYREVDVAGAIADALQLPNDDIADIYYYVYGYAVAVEAAQGDTVQTIYLADSPDGATNLFKVELGFLFDGAVQVGDYVGTMGMLYHYPQGSTPECGLQDAYIWSEEDPNPATGLHDAVSTFDIAAPSYNIVGQKVPASYKGIVIQNGKKYIRL